jgi:hypothetical protein
MTTDVNASFLHDCNGVSFDFGFFRACGEDV